MRSSGLIIALYLCVLSERLKGGLGLVTSGTLPGTPGFSYYAGKFCFDVSKNAIAGQYTLDVTGLATLGNLSNGTTSGRLWLFVYDDEKDHTDGPGGPSYNEHHWHFIRSHWESVTCDERKAWASGFTDITPLKREQRFTINIRESIRPRFWYFTFGNCGANITGSVNYRLHMVNPLKGPEKELSMDKHGSFWLHGVGAFAFALLCIIQFLAVRCSAGPRSLSFRPLLTVLMLSALLSAVGEACLTAHFNAYASDGIGIEAMKIWGTLGASLSKASLSILQLMIARGWGILKSSLTLLWIVAIGTIVVLTVSAEVYGELVHDASTTLYLYDGFFGILILVVNAVLFIAAFKEMKTTYANESSAEMRDFYFYVSVAMIIFFLSLPFACILAHLFSPWVRAKYVARMEISARFLAAALLTYSLWPSSRDIMINARVDGLQHQVRDYGPGEDELEELEPARE